jgi:hypothetical protein
MGFNSGLKGLKVQAVFYFSPLPAPVLKPSVQLMSAIRVLFINGNFVKNYIFFFVLLEPADESKNSVVRSTHFDTSAPSFLFLSLYL